MKYEDYLIHFNPNHDPKNGRFAKNNGVQYSKNVGKSVSKINPKHIAIGSILAAGGGILIAKHIKKKKEFSIINNMTIGEAFQELKDSGLTREELFGDLADDPLAMAILDRLLE